MKKIFKLSHEKIQPQRLVESIKHEIKKYIKRERNKKLTDDADFIDFDCKFGENADVSEMIRLSEINKMIDGAVAADQESFYLEVMAKPGYKNKPTG